MATIFTKIINGEIPCHKVYEDKDYLSFMDIRPMKKGHLLVIPKKEIDYIFDLDDELLKGLLLVSKKIAAAMRKVIPCRRIGLMVAGLEVPHTHIHLIPIDVVGDLNFANAKQADSKELAEITEKIKAHITSNG